MYISPPFLDNTCSLRHFSSLRCGSVLLQIPNLAGQLVPLKHDHDKVHDFRKLAMTSAKNQQPCLQSHMSKISTRSYTKMWSIRGLHRSPLPTMRAVSTYRQPLRSKKYWPEDVHYCPSRPNSAVSTGSLFLVMHSHPSPFVLHSQYEGRRTEPRTQRRLEKALAKHSF